MLINMVVTLLRGTLRNCYESDKCEPAVSVRRSVAAGVFQGEQADFGEVGEFSSHKGK